MRTRLVITFIVLNAATAMPAFSQAAPTNPGRSVGEHMRDMRNATREEFARDVSQFRRMSAADRTKVADAYRKLTEPHRLNALQIAETARSGTELPPNAGPRIRAALEADLNAWHDAFYVDRRDWKAMHDRWLVDADKLTGQQWAQQRADWFAARDVWIAQWLQRSEPGR